MLVGAMLQRSTTTNRSSLYLCQGLDSKLKDLDWSSLLIFSIFSSLVGFSSGTTYILYQYISSFRWPLIYDTVFSAVCASWSFRLWRWKMTFSDTEMKKLGRSPRNNTHSKRSLIRTYQVCHRRLAVGGGQQVYKHTGL